VDDEMLHETDDGVYGLAEVVADFDDRDLRTLRRLAAVVRTAGRPDVVSAIALAGSAAQSKFQLFPGDCDFFERVHIRAGSRDDAIRTLIAVMIDTVARAFPDPDLQFSEMKLGLHQRDVVRDAEVLHARSPVSWSLRDLDARTMAVTTVEGEPAIIDIREVAADPGFVKLDWIFADAARDRIVAVSKVIDATWEAPDGTIVPLDGVLDAFYQEVYLDADDKEHVERLIDQVRPDGLRAYVAQLEGEIRKYTAAGHENYGKVAKRLYNIFRITGRAGPAAHLRGLFDDPPARLYQIPATLYALGQVLGGRRLDAEVVESQLSGLIDILETCYAGEDCEELVALVRVLPQLEGDQRREAVDRLTDVANAQVSAYFETEIRKDADIAAYLDSLASE
jgi:hypothetical protein